jgi:DNA-binding NtrC family response regulator
MRNTLPMGADRGAREQSRPFYLWVARSPGTLDVFPISALRTHLGREPGAGVDLVLSDPAVSRVHAVLVAYPGEDTLWFQDLESSNGVFVNGRKVDGAAVRAGDVIRVGDSVLVVGRGSPAPAEAARDLGLVGRALPVVELREVIRKAAPSALPVLIIGPTGTGKELVARALHEQSGRAGRVVAVNCAALPATLVESVLFGHRKGSFTGATSDQEGAFVQANGGTLFLDEVGDLSLEAQPKLLRALENGEVTPVGATSPLAVDVRVVAATHVPLDAALGEGRFREDLYARLAGLVIKTPALADRREDIPLLFSSFLGERGERPMSADFAESLVAYGWPFNVRELKKLADRLLVLHPEAPLWERGMLDDEMVRAPSAEPPPEAERRPGSSKPPAPRTGPPPREELIALLDQCEGNVSKVAELMQRNRKQVYRWMKQHAVDPGTGRKE